MAYTYDQINNMYGNVYGRNADILGNEWLNHFNTAGTAGAKYASADDAYKAFIGASESGNKTFSLADAIKRPSGYMSGYENTLADEWFYNTLGRTATGDEVAQWDAKIASLGTNAAYDAFTNQFSGTAGYKPLDRESASQLIAPGGVQQIPGAGGTKTEAGKVATNVGGVTGQLDFSGLMPTTPVAGPLNTSLLHSAGASTTPLMGSAQTGAAMQLDPNSFTVDPNKINSIYSGLINSGIGQTKGVQDITAQTIDGPTTYDVQTVTPVGYTPETHTVDYNKETMAGQIGQIIKEDSPLMQLAATKGMQMANDRGLANSSMGIQAAQMAVYEYAAPIAKATADAYLNTALFNVEQKNTANRFFAEQSNLANRFNAEQTNAMQAKSLELNLNKQIANAANQLEAAKANQDTQRIIALQNSMNELTLARDKASAEANALQTNARIAADVATSNQSVYTNLQIANAQMENALTISQQNNAFETDRLRTSNDYQNGRLLTELDADRERNRVNNEFQSGRDVFNAATQGALTQLKHDMNIEEINLQDSLANSRQWATDWGATGSIINTLYMQAVSNGLSQEQFNGMVANYLQPIVEKGLLLGVLDGDDEALIAEKLAPYKIVAKTGTTGATTATTATDATKTGTATGTTTTDTTKTGAASTTTTGTADTTAGGLLDTAPKPPTDAELVTKYGNEIRSLYSSILGTTPSDSDVLYHAKLADQQGGTAGIKSAFQERANSYDYGYQRYNGEIRSLLKQALGAEPTEDQVEHHVRLAMQQGGTQGIRNALLKG